jgi:hypothetical protein
MKLDNVQNKIEYVTRLGRGGGCKLLVVRFTTYGAKLVVLRNTRQLRGSNISVDEDIDQETGKVTK